MDKKVILFGCQQIAIDIMRCLHANPEVHIAKVVTYEVLSDISRGQESLKEEARKLGLDVASPSTITSSLIKEVESIQPDLILSAYYRKIFPRRLISLATQGIINIHPSKLPDYRGPVPTAWAILNGETTFGITVHKIDEGIDTGDILLQEEFPIGEYETGFELYLRAMKLGAGMVAKNLSAILDETLEPRPQEKGGSYYGKLTQRTLLDWKSSAVSIKNHVRVRSKPYNPIETILENKYFFINRVTIDKEFGGKIQIPGRILKVFEDDRLLVSCADGAVILEEYDVYPPFTGVEKDIYLKSGRVFDNP